MPVKTKEFSANNEIKCYTWTKSHYGIYKSVHMVSCKPTIRYCIFNLFSVSFLLADYYKYLLVQNNFLQRVSFAKYDSLDWYNVKN